MKKSNWVFYLINILITIIGIILLNVVSNNYNGNSFGIFMICMTLVIVGWIICVGLNTVFFMEKRKKINERNKNKDNL